MTERKWDMQPCWSCKKACGGCSWTEVEPDTGKIRFEPIAGWDAERVAFHEGRGTPGETYKIYACPEYDKEPERPTSAEEIKQTLIERAARLYKDGWLPTEIAVALRIRTRKILELLEEAKKQELL